MSESQRYGIAFIAGILAAIWPLAYLLHHLIKMAGLAWWGFPAFITALIVCGALGTGVAGAVYAGLKPWSRPE